MHELLSLRKTIEKYNLLPKKNLGQNFLLDQNITDKIVRFAEVHPEDNILEIGPGPGGLTRSILARGPKKVIVVEQDARCIAALNELKNNYQQFEIINNDALKTDECALVPLGSKIIANLPYNIGTLLLFKWFQNIQHWQSLTLMFQKEVAERINAVPSTKDYGRLSVISQLLCDIKWNFDLAPAAFFPPPKVTSSVITLYPKHELPSKKLLKTIELITQILFNQRRKMLRSTLKNVHHDMDALIEGTGVILTQRPEELSVNQFVQIANNLMGMKNNG